MKSFLTNPTEYILNMFGYSLEVKRSLILNHILSTTNNSWVKRIQDNGHIDQYRFSLYSTEE